MALTVKHSTTVVVMDDPAYPVGTNEWNANHTVSGDLTDFVANPTASVGLTAVNGSATTAMRSDGAPALDQTAAYAFSGLGATTITDATQSTTITTGSLKTAGGLGVVKDVFIGGTVNAANTISGTNLVATTGFVRAAAASNFQWSARALMLSPADGTVQFANNAVTNSFMVTAAGVTATPVLQLGAANAASPVAQTLQAQGSRAGTDSNVGGASITYQAGQGTGTGLESHQTFKTPIKVGSGSGAQTMLTALDLFEGVPAIPSYAFASLPTIPAAGMLAYITDSNTVTWGAIVAGGGANPVLAWFNGANWTVMGK